ncbi:hypothetical protein VCHC56A1_1896, partial [Vibrio cholerae HC-56A1]
MLKLLPFFSDLSAFFF